jgi:hypothetical protein
MNKIELINIRKPSKEEFINNIIMKTKQLKNINRTIQTIKSKFNKNKLKTKILKQLNKLRCFFV